MNCQSSQNESDKYREGKLSGDLRIQVESHLEHCNDCAESFRIESAADSIINRERAIEPENDLAFRIMERIETLETTDKKITNPFMRVLQPALIVTSIAATIFIGILIGNIYKPSGTYVSRPVEFSLIDDASIESIDILSNE
jgi:hypothetical protein